MRAMIRRNREGRVQKIVAKELAQYRGKSGPSNMNKNGVNFREHGRVREGILNGGDKDRENGVGPRMITGGLEKTSRYYAHPDKKGWGMGWVKCHNRFLTQKQTCEPNGRKVCSPVTGPAWREKGGESDRAK